MERAAEMHQVSPVVSLKVEDVAPSGYTLDRATVRQKKTGQPVRFEMTEQTRQSVDDYIRAAGKKSGEFLFIGRHGPGQCMTTRQYARLVSGWVGSIGLDPKLFGTHSLRRTKATLIYRRTGNLRVRLRMRPAQSRCTQPGDVSHQDWRFPAVSRVRQRGLRHSIWLNLIAEAHSQTDS